MTSAGSVRSIAAFRWKALRLPPFRQLLAFVWNSGAGLAADLTVFSLLVLAGVSPFVANLASTAVAITLVYLLVTRYAFRAGASVRSYVLFFGWYAASALLTSTAIDLLCRSVWDVPLGWKLLSVPVTFTTNYLFSRFLFQGGGRASGGPVASPRSAPVPVPAGDSSPWPWQAPAVRSALQWVARRPWAASAVATVLFGAFVLPMNVAVSFHEPATGRDILREHLLRIGFLVALWLVLAFLVRFVRDLVAGDVFTRVWAAGAAAYAAVQLVVLALVYPGNWIWDEYFVLMATTRFESTAWQGFLTNVLYTWGMFLVPSAMGILFVQVAFVALVVGYLVASLHRRMHRRRLAFLVLLPFLALPTLFNDLYPLRLTGYAYLLVLLLTQIWNIGPSAERWRSLRPGQWFGLVVEVGVLAFWRSEGVYLLLLVPVALVLAARVRGRRPDLRMLVVRGTAALAVVGSLWVLTAGAADPKYQLTATINPLSTMVQGDLQGPDVARDLEAIDRVVPVAALRAKPSYIETPALRDVRPDFAAHVPAYNRAVLDLIVHNPGPFLWNRWHALLAANSMERFIPLVRDGGVLGGDVALERYAQTFQAENAFSAPLVPGIRQPVQRALLLLGPQNELTPAGRVLWNAIPSLVGLLVVTVLLALRRHRIGALAGVLLLANALLVALTEPGHYFMYFFPAYLGANAIIAVVLLLALDRRLERRRAGGTAGVPEAGS